MAAHDFPFDDDPDDLDADPSDSLTPDLPDFCFEDDEDDDAAGVAGELRDPKDSDPFCPPDDPVMVACLHCGKEYISSLVEYKRDDPMNPYSVGFWTCATHGCDGLGFGCDIFPTDPHWVDPKGELHRIEDDDEDLDDELPDIDTLNAMSLAALEEGDPDDFDLDFPESPPSPPAPAPTIDELLRHNAFVAGFFDDNGRPMSPEKFFKAE